MSPLAVAVEDMLAAIGKQRTAEARGAPCRLLTSDALLGFDAFHLVGELLVQPLQVNVGGKLGSTFSHEAGLTLWERARNRRDFVVIDGADDDIYDKEEYVDQGIEHLTALYDEYLRMSNGGRLANREP